MSPRRAPMSAVTLTARGVLRGALRLAPLAPFVIPFGLAFGAAAVAAGFTPAQAVGMSAVVFAGASQFAALEVWAHPMPWATLVAVGLAVNARFLVMSAALAPWANALPRWRRSLALAVLADASFAQERPRLAAGERDFGVILGGGLSQWAPWVVGTALGATLGAAASDLARFGVDVVMVCFFGALAASGLKRRANWAPSAAGASAALGVMGWVGAGWAVVIGALAGSVVAAVTPDRAA
jgi:Predicted branched-chain amino acid permease (azaleucine resistance)